ncbi:hypothetical protein DSCO28_00130 [Desulfosarcina ovata subsp. sediminis]|uniref:AMP-dependent synthetase/ligase domain-containing protein n=3 Tax=Desulfosarcina ovata TaxID=83564 RepID=A0A5K8A2W4_9BACT|nr:hypothetical protein DSCO28_00130 [Desulfosarcina ovata subsp. sediminis]BBO86837.1 hypothetical protein DSCOOX_00170 [Desulfosarcina ovata subsp. ovata]
MGFGQTENSAMVLMPQWASDKKPGSMGLPNFFTELWIEDNNGEKLPPGQIGEVVATGPSVMKEYWHMPRETSGTIINDKLYTGDLGYLDEDGFVYVVDRAKDMYRTGGENVYPAEVEAILSYHPKIEAVAIIGVPSDKWGETGKAYIECRPGESLILEDIHSFLNGKVAKYKLPTIIKIVDALPRTVWGKIKKAEIRKWK